jgi:hypothetical protein
MEDFRREFCGFCKFGGAVGLSRGTYLYLARRLLLRGEEKWKKIEEFLERIFEDSILRFGVSLVVFLVYQEGRICVWLVVYYW